MLKTILLLLAAASSLPAQCLLNFVLYSGTRSAVFDNRTAGCYLWRATFTQPTGSQAVIVVQTAATNHGPWFTLPGTSSSSSSDVLILGAGTPAYLSVLRLSAGTGVVSGSLSGSKWTIGPEGPTGATGAAGPQGIQGIAGPTGATGAQGPAGATGPQGIQGPSGGGGGGGGTTTGTVTPTNACAAGDLYTNTTNGSLYLCSPSNTWLLKGATGPTGATGSAGAAGATGATGPAGSAGAAGATGATGASGVAAATAPITYNSGTQTVACNAASGSQPGCLSSADWTAFNSRLSANQSITWTAAGDLSGAASGATSITPAVTVAGIKGAAVPTLATGNLRYNGSAWVFDATAYQASLGFTAENSANKDAVSGYAGLDGSGKLKTSEAPTWNQSTTGNAATSTALDHTPTACSAGQGATGVLASGSSTGCTTYVVPGTASQTLIGTDSSGQLAALTSPYTSQHASTTNFVPPGLGYCGTYTASYTDYTGFAATSGQIKAFDAPARWKPTWFTVEDAGTMTSSSGTVTAVAAALGTVASPAAYLNAFPLVVGGSGGSSPTFIDVQPGLSAAATATGTQSVYLQLAVTNGSPGNLSTLTAGSIKVIYCGSVLQ